MPQVVRAAKVQRNFGAYQDRALVEPVVVTKYGRESVVILSAAEYRRLKRLDRQTLAVTELDEADIDAIATAEVDARYTELDGETR